MINLTNKKHLKNVGPIHHCEPPHAHSPDVASGTVARRLRIDVHDNADNDNAWQRGPLWPHGMGRMKHEGRAEHLVSLVRNARCLCVTREGRCSDCRAYCMRTSHELAVCIGTAPKMNDDAQLTSLTGAWLQCACTRTGQPASQRRLCSAINAGVCAHWPSLYSYRSAYYVTF